MIKDYFKDELLLYHDLFVHSKNEDQILKAELLLYN